MLVDPIGEPRPILPEPQGAASPVAEPAEQVTSERIEPTSRVSGAGSHALGTTAIGPRGNIGPPIPTDSGGISSKEEEILDLVSEIANLKLNGSFGLTESTGNEAPSLENAKLVKSLETLRSANSERRTRPEAEPEAIGRPLLLEKINTELGEIERTCPLRSFRALDDELIDLDSSADPALNETYKRALTTNLALKISHAYQTSPRPRDLPGALSKTADPFPLEDSSGLGLSNCAAVSFTDELNTEDIFRDSEEFYKVRPGSLFAESGVEHMLPIKREFFGLLQSLMPRDAGGKFLPREKGLRKTLRIYLSLLKNYQPNLYAVSLEAAKSLKAQKPLSKDTKAVISIAAHQSEKNLTERLGCLSVQLSMGDLEPRDHPVFIFVNGDDPKEISERNKEIDEFARTHPKMDIRIIAARPSSWRMGLKSIPYTVASMSLAMAGLADRDIPVLLTDADTVAYPINDVEASKIESIRGGRFFSSGTYLYDAERLKDENINLYILARLHNLRVNYFRARRWLRTLGAEDREFASAKILGGNGSISIMLANLVGGISPHEMIYEDRDLSRKAGLAVIMGFGIRTAKGLEELNAIETDDEFFDNSVIIDGDPIRRVAASNNSVYHHAEHNLPPGPLPAIDMDRPREINTERIGREMDYMLEACVGAARRSTSIQAVEANAAQRARLIAIADREMSALKMEMNTILDELEAEGYSFTVPFRFGV